MRKWESGKVRKSEGYKIRRQRTDVSLRPIGAYAPVGGRRSEHGKSRGKKVRGSEEQKIRSQRSEDG